MRTFLLKLLTFAGLVAGGFLLLMHWHPREEDNQFVRAIIDKEAQLRATPSPRLLLVGGSNIALGVDSAALERATGLPTRNLAVTGGLGYEFILNQAAAHVRAGDRVVLSLAHYLFADDPPLARVLSPTLKAEPQAFRYLGIRQWKALLDGELLTLSYTVRTSLANARGDYTPAHGAYRRDGFNARGDLVSHHGLPSSPPSVEAFTLPDSSLRETLAAIAAFVAHCRAQGATVYYELSPWPENWIQAHPMALQRIYTGLRGVPGLVLLNTPADVSLPVHLFYDNEYHLNEAGATLHTQRLIQWLSAARPQ